MRQPDTVGRPDVQHRTASNRRWLGRLRQRERRNRNRGATRGLYAGATSTAHGDQRRRADGIDQFLSRVWRLQSLFLERRHWVVDRHLRPDSPNPLSASADSLTFSARTLASRALLQQVTFTNNRSTAWDVQFDVKASNAPHCGGIVQTPLCAQGDRSGTAQLHRQRRRLPCDPSARSVHGVDRVRAAGIVQAGSVTRRRNRGARQPIDRRGGFARDNGFGLIRRAKMRRAAAVRFAVSTAARKPVSIRISTRRLRQSATQYSIGLRAPGSSKRRTCSTSACRTRALALVPRAPRRSTGYITIGPTRTIDTPPTCRCVPA